MASASTLWPIFFSSMLIAWLTDRCSKYSYGTLGERIYQRKDIWFFTALVLLMCTFIGLRNWCNDTGTYRETYEYLTSSTGPLLDGISWKIADSPAFFLINTVLKHIGFSSQDFLMFYAFLTNGLCLWFLRKYSSDFWLSIFLFFTMGVYLFSAAGMRQAVAVAIGLLGIDRLLQKKWGTFLIWVLLASLFHPYALMFLAAPLLTFASWTMRTWILFAVFGIIGIELQGLIGTILDITSMFGKEYNEVTFTGEGVNTFRLLVIWSPIVLSFLTRNLMQRSEDKANNLFMNFSMLNAEIMFVALFGTANYFARLANYFLIFQTLSLPWMLRYFSPQSRRTLKIIIVICYMLYFIFANVILTPFNSYFAKMTLAEYLHSIF